MATAADPPRIIDRGSGVRGRARPRPVVRRLLTTTCAALVVSLAFSAGAWAAPANDAFDAAMTISALPFATVVDTTGAGRESLAPEFCNSTDATAWYAITPTEDGVLDADTIGSSRG